MKCRNAGIIIENPDTTAIKLMPIVYSNGNAGYELTFESGGSRFFIKDIRKFIECLQTLLPPTDPPLTSTFEIPANILKDVGYQVIKAFDLETINGREECNVYHTGRGVKTDEGIGAVVLDIVMSNLTVTKKEGV